MSDPHTIDINRDPSELKTITTLVYAMQAASLLLGVTYFVAIIINYVKLDDVRGSWMESHFRWQIRTFWYSLLWTFIGIVGALLLVGYLVLFANFIWFIYRVVKGWTYLNDGKPMYTV